jgi:hypothetical protein
MSINDNLFILYFHLNFDTKFEQYREHYVQIYEMSRDVTTNNIEECENRVLMIEQSQK